MVTLIIATRNAHKVREIAGILGPGVHCLPLTGFEGVPELIEDGSTFLDNARAKASQLADWLRNHSTPLNSISVSDRVLVLADDSGLEVDALRGAPGVHSARFAAMDSGKPGNSSDEDNNAKLLRLLRDVPASRRTARFRCVLALQPLQPAGDSFESFEGTCEGCISSSPAGGGGFGYDPLFIPEGGTKSFAELNEAKKNSISHRSRALAQLRQRLILDGVAGPHP